MKPVLFIASFLILIFSYGQNYAPWKSTEYKKRDTILVPNETIRGFGYYNWYNLNPKAYTYLADFLNYHPEILELKILNHTSYRGSHDKNIEISQRRAQYLAEHLKEQCPSIKFSFEGLGEDYPFTMIDSNGQKQILNSKYISSIQDKVEYERLHALNRRFEFVVLKSDSTQLEKRLYADIRFSEPKKGLQYLIPEVRFDFDKWTFIQNETFNSVDSLKIIADYLKENPLLIIEVQYHTDCRGSKSYSRRLDQKRAESIVDCLMEKYGISEDRLLPKGYGETTPRKIQNEDGLIVYLTCEYIIKQASKETQERMHQMNRRAEFKILSTDFKPK